MMPHPPRLSLSDEAFRRVALLGSLGAFLLFVLVAVAIARYGDHSLDLGWTPGHDGSDLIVRAVRPGGPADGRLRPGDRILALDGDRRTTRLVAIEGMGFRGWRPPRAEYELTIDRAGERRLVRLRAGAERSVERRRLSQSSFAAAAVWCLVPALITLFRPGHRVARHAYAATMFVGMATLAEARVPALPWAPRGMYEALLLVYPFAPLHLAVAFHLTLRFPPGVAASRAHTVIAVVLYAVCGALCLEGPLLDTGVLLTAPALLPRVRSALAPLDDALGIVEGLVYPAALAAIVALLFRNYRTVANADGRRRLRWLLWGTVVGLTPSIVVVACSNLADLAGLPLDVDAWIVPANLVTTVVPLTLGYAIVKHQLFDISVVIRRGLRYLLARNGLRVLLAIPVAGLVYGAAAERHRPLGEVLLTNRLYLYLIGATLVSLWYRRQLLDWVDRRFFREAYDRERILMQLVDDVQDLESASGVSKLVSHELEAAFHPECLFIWYREPDRPTLTLSYSSGRYLYHADLGPSSPLVLLAERRRGIVHLPLDDPDALPDADRQWLATAGVSLIVPVVGSDHEVLGLLMLGRKKSEEPYSPDDVKLLQAVARQIAIGRDNLRLRERVEHEREIRHNVLSHLETEGFNLLKECPACGRCFDARAAVCEADGAEPAPTLPIERTIEGKYRLDRRIGRGGMGAVYEATDLRLARPVAVKVMTGRAFGDRQALRRFEREARACARLSHPNIVTAYDFGAVGANGAFLVMELVRGQTLRTELRRRGCIPPALTAQWFDQICAAVAAAHAQGVVHLDLKPENVLITTARHGADLVKVVDFGLAKLTAGSDQEASSLTQPGMIMGTLSYMAPEQLTAGEADERSDVFAIGVMIVEALLGRPPFAGRTQTELLLSILNESVTLDARQGRLQEVLRRATAGSAADRYQSVADLSRELQPALAAMADDFPTGRLSVP